MGSNSAPTPPPAPDPTVVAGAQTTSNLATAQAQSQLNNTNIVGPDGSLTYTQPGGPDTPYTQTTTLSPQEQAIYNAQTANEAGALNLASQDQGNVANALGQTVSAPTMQGSVANGAIASGYNAGGPIQTQIGGQNINQSVSNAEFANFAQQMGLLQPQMTQASEQQQAQMAAQGLNPNSAAYQNSQQLFNNGQATELQQAAEQAVGAGNAEQNTLFGQQATSGEFANQAQAQQNEENAGAATFANTAQGQGNEQALANATLGNNAAQSTFNNQVTAQQLPIQEYQALEGGAQVQAPQSTPAQTSVAPTDVTGAYALQQQALQQDYQSQMQSYNSSLGGLFNLGSAAMMAFA